MTHPGGRPTDYKPEYCEQAREMLKKGFSKVEIAAAFDVNRKTLDRWAAENEQFSHTINEDLDFSESWWMGQGRESLCKKDFNSRLWEINMMNRFGWMKRTDQNNKHSGDIGLHETDRKLRNADEQYK